MDVVYYKSTNIVTGIGFSTDEVMVNLRQGHSGLRQIGCFGTSEMVMASVVDQQRLDLEFSAIAPPELYTRFEKIALLSVTKAVQEAGIDSTSERVIVVLATTKGNIELLEQGNKNDPRLELSHSAALIASVLGNHNRPIVISNACISGVSAQITAQRALLTDGRYDYAVVVGADVISKFVISGFQSFKALDTERCRPFDLSRAGLNLGEGAATVVLARAAIEELPRQAIYIESGAITNDANHISGPSRTGEGLFQAIKKYDTTDLGFVNVHGTATPYNDQMEALALNRAGLDQVPIFSLKPYFGHTLGAAGLLESIVSCQCMKHNWIPSSLGYEKHGVTEAVNVSTRSQVLLCDKMLKTISGFGGCNAALVLKKRSSWQK